MKHHLTKRVSVRLFLVVGLIAFFLFGQVLLAAWAPPAQDPPAGNVSAPLNTSAGAQIKSGGVSLGSLVVNGGSLFKSNVTMNSGTGGTQVFTMTTDGTENQNIRLERQPGAVDFLEMGKWFNTAVLNSDAPFSFRKNGTEIVRFDGSLAYKSGLGNGVGDSGTLSFSIPSGGLGVVGWSRGNGHRREVRFDDEGLSFVSSATVNGAGKLMTIAETGKVGIGTSTPSVKLEVNGNIKASGGGAIIYGSGSSNVLPHADLTVRVPTSGFYETNTATDGENWPTGANSWWHLINVQHSNTTSNYALQIAGSFWGDDLFYRKTANDGTRAWQKFVDEDSSGNVSITGDVTAAAYYHSSDRRLKKNILKIKNPLEKIQALNGVDFNWKKNGEKSIGFIAQDLEKVLPELVQADKETKLKSVQYANITAILVEAVKEQQKQIEKLKAEINKLK